MRASEIPVGIRTLAALLVLLGLLAPLPAMAQAAPNHISAQLVAQGPIKPGEPLSVAILFRPDKGWHGYWSNPGDAGFGMTLDWHLPPGWKAGTPRYPVPQQLVIGGLMNNVYEGPYAVLVRLSVPRSYAPRGFSPISLDAHWLACTEEICVPEAAHLLLRIPSSPDPAFDAYRAALPPLLDTKAHFAFTGNRLRLAIPLPATMPVGAAHVFLKQDQVIDYVAPQGFTRSGNWLVASIKRGGMRKEPAGLSGIVSLGQKGEGLRFEAVPGPVPSGGKPVGVRHPEAGLAWLALAALAGGLLLNLMPCVFPILSLKALTLARAGENEVQARREALAYSAGVVIACLALGSLLLALRAAGAQIGWAFQLQEPGIVVALLVLAAAITANFAGLFELPSLAITRLGGQSSAFATGLLAAFVATPCTGPFMAAALGAALLLPWGEALVLFAALGLGLALPFLLLGFVPALRDRLPAPGKWMNTFRKLMALPMGLTTLALAWLAWRAGGQTFAVMALVVVGGVVTALLVAGQLQRRGRHAWSAFGLIALPFAVFGAVALPMTQAHSAHGEKSILDPVPYSPAALASARASGKPVFLWFTADWCLTCKVNEQVAIERQATKAAFAKAGVIAMRGDWTRRNPAITDFLTDQGAAGVPLYMWYPAGGGPGKRLPQVLTPHTLVALARSG